MECKLATRSKQYNWPKRRQTPVRLFPYKGFKLPKDVILSLSLPVCLSTCSFILQWIFYSVYLLPPCLKPGPTTGKIGRNQDFLASEHLHVLFLLLRCPFCHHLPSSLSSLVFSCYQPSCCVLAQPSPPAPRCSLLWPIPVLWVFSLPLLPWKPLKGKEYLCT